MLVCLHQRATEQNLAGLQWVIEAVRKQYHYRGKPDVRFLLTPIPPIKELQPMWIGKAEKWITDTWGTSEALSVGELHTDILYNPAVPTLKSFVEEIDNEITVSYQPITDTIAASLSVSPSMGYSTSTSHSAWIRTRMSDGNGNSFPRSIILLLQEAVEHERSYNEQSNTDAEQATYRVILRPKALTESLRFVSERRVEEVRDEYPELADYLDTLKGERSPIDQERLQELWKKSDAKLKDVIEEMKQAGILQEYMKHGPSDAARYSVAELYVLGLGMTRKGQR